MSSLRVYGSAQSAPENLSRAAARVNQMMIAVDAEPNTALAWLEIGWVVPGRGLPQPDRWFAGWVQLKPTHSGPDPAETDWRALMLYSRSKPAVF